MPTDNALAEIRAWAASRLSGMSGRNGSQINGERVTALHHVIRLVDYAGQQAAELDRLRQIGLWFDAIRFALADHEGELPPAPDVTAQAVRNLLKRESYHEGRHERYLDRVDELTVALDDIRATCIAAGIPGETDEPAGPDATDPAPVRTSWSTPTLVRRLADALRNSEEAAEQLRERNEQLTRWLEEIDGGDYPIHDADRLRNMAFAALRGDEVTNG